MPTLDVRGTHINYVDEGSGPPVLLVHGFASNLEDNWRAPGIFDALVAAGHRTIALDCRGHGKSGKPHDPHAYDGTAMQDDVIALLDHLGVDQAGLGGYSMGGFLSAQLIVRHPQRFSRAVLAGVGDAVVTGFIERRGSEIADALESPTGESANPTARGFRLFAERSGNDLAALAAMQRSSRHQFDGSLLAGVRIPVLVLVGEGDTLVGAADKLLATIPHAKLVRVPGDHITAVAKPKFRQAIVDFFT
jgi:pimeloyl-ACP methyl ester carboxylesterase